MAEISRRYGKALYDLAIEHHTLDTCLDQATFVRDLIRQPETRQILEHPHVPKGEKRQLLQTAFSVPLAEPLGSYLELLITKNREGILLSSLTEFLKLGDRRRGIVEAHVVSAVELRAEQAAALQNLLTTKLSKQIEMTFAVDPALIGGFYLNVDGYTVDSSVRRRLQDMKNSIQRGEGFDAPST